MRRAVTSHDPISSAPAQTAAASVTIVGDTSITVVSVNTWANQSLNVDFGNHKLVFPANSICSLGTSSYGPSEWDKPCVPEIGSVLLEDRAKKAIRGSRKLTLPKAIDIMELVGTTVGIAR